MIMTKMTMGTFVCLMFMIGLSIVYFSKERENTLENKYFTITMVLIIIGLIIHVLVEYAAFYYVPILSTIILKAVLYYYVAYDVLFLSYLLLLLKLKYAKLYIKIANIILLITFVVITILPEQLYAEGEIGYTYGPDTKVVFAAGFLSYFIIMFLFILKYKSINKRDRTYIFAFLTGLLLASVIQKNRPEIQISIFVEAAVCSANVEGKVAEKQYFP